MCQDKLISYCCYEGEESRFDDIFVKFWASTSEYYPDYFYTMDLAVTENSIKLLELNSFVSAGLYDMDFSEVVHGIEYYSKF
jgi:hypothetical protein